MSTHTAEVRWTLGVDEDFVQGRYSRVHRLRFGALSVEGSASPSIVSPPYASHDAVDPEAAFVASLSACHMLWFLDLARRAGVEVRGYVDEASGVLGRNADGRQAMTEVTLRPRVECDSDAATLAQLHHRAHDHCFIANSVTTRVNVEV